MGTRTIIFRGKRVDTGEWIEGFYAKSGDKTFILIDNDIAVGYVAMKEVIPETVGQYTGLTDKNGKKIFEGDIVKYDKLYMDGKETKEIGYFECDEQFVSFRIHGKQMTPFYCEVIGNIFDNAELLDGNK